MRRAGTAGAIALVTILGAACSGPRFAVPTERSSRIAVPSSVESGERHVETQGALAYGRDEVEPTLWEEVVRLPLASGARAYWRRQGKLTGPPRRGRPLVFRHAPGPVLQVADRHAKSPADLRPAFTAEIEALHKLLHPLFKKSAVARAWLAQRTDLEALRLDLQRRLNRRAESAPPGAPSLLDALHTFYRQEQREIPNDERRLRRDSRIIGGLVGWERGNYSGLSWSAPFFLETHDERKNERDLVLFPFLSGGSSSDEGQTTILGPLLSYSSDKATLDERSGGTMVLGTGRLFWESARRGRRELDIWPAASLISYSKPGQTWAVSPPTLGFYLSQEKNDTKKRWLVLPPLLAAFYRYRTPATTDELEHDRSFYFALGPFIMGETDRVGARERSRTLLIPLLGYHSAGAGENVPEGTEIVDPREASSTYLLGGLVHWSGKSPGRYRAKDIEDAPVRTVGDDESSWWFLPLVSYEADKKDDSSELMLWPLLGLGFGSEEGESYVRLFYFWKIGGKT